MIFNKLPKSIDIGYEGEQNSRPLELDISEGLAKWAGSVPTLLYIRPGENLAVPAATTLDDGILTWIPDAYATAKSGGTGALQIVFTIEATNTVIGKSQVIPMTVNASLIESEDPPEPYESWIASLLAAAAEAEGSAQDAEAWAVGERGGADVGSSDPAYHNNAKYYAEQAAESAEEAAESAEEASRSYAPAIRANASGAVAHFTDGAVGLMALDIAINPVQEEGGIIGHTSVTVSRSGADTSDADEYEIALPGGAGTVYGGTLHINQDGSGVLTVDRAITTVNNKSWQYTTNNTRFYATFSDIKLFPVARTVPFTSSVFVSIDDGRGVGNVPNNGIYVGASNSTTVYIKCTDYTTEEAFKTAYGSAQIVYPLANPSTYTFTAQQISSLLGENNVWADTGDVTAEYTADTKAYIERLTQPDQDWVADAGISSGEYFMVGNELYIATIGIAAGETITPGTNCTKKSLAEALNAINA